MLAASHFSFPDYMPSSLSGSEDPEVHDVPPSPGMLTRRQEAIAQRVARGETCAVIAEDLQVPARTIEGHIYRILETLDLSSMTDLTEQTLDQYRARLETHREPAVAEYLTVAEIALRMRVSKMTVYRLMQSGFLESVRFGRSYRVTQRALQQYLDSCNDTTDGGINRIFSTP